MDCFVYDIGLRHERVKNSCNVNLFRSRYSNPAILKTNGFATKDNYCCLKELHLRCGRFPVLHLKLKQSNIPIKHCCFRENEAFFCGI